MKRKLKILILLVTFLSLVGGGYYIYRHVYIKHQSEIRFEKYLKKHSDAKPIAHKDLFYDTIRGNYGMIVTYRDEPARCVI
ncbi:DUF3139 domain-containing protein [Heyndrickxia acidiproducens]|uniref:DUF3139 domain-containing protein n=1 Tax=Heyndrickxia acidiproducens TaxID=1121084 RepID=UPI00035E36AB|nr:DUF3139 domain-containing protein [Heyndrickxia acidiproducens]